MHITPQLIVTLSVLVELLIYLKILWHIRVYLLPAVALAICASTVFYIFKGEWFVDILIIYFSIYRLVNLLRVYLRKIKPKYLFFSARRASCTLGLMQVFVAAAQIVISKNHISLNLLLDSLSLLSLASTVLLTKVFLSNRKSLTQFDQSAEPNNTSLPPTLTVAIPARNETEDLIDCLNSLLGSNYPKLEIIVLDDCSQERRTPEILRDFAQKGVIFIGGNEPPENWLAKNYAYEQLTEVSNGEFILFCGVDTRFDPDSLTRLINLALTNKLEMVSLLPINYPTNDHKLFSHIVQPLRYAWELTLPRLLRRRPPVLSTCWMIRRATLIKAGKFKGIRRKVLPETYFARLTSKSDRYALWAANLSMPIFSRKTIEEKRSTSIRTRYPQLHKHLELSALLTLAIVAVFISPIIVLITGIFLTNYLVCFLSLASFMIASYTFSSIVNLTYRKFKLSNLGLFMPAVFYDMWLLNYSMYRYEFKEVLWKGRNICIPVMSRAN